MVNELLLQRMELAVLRQPLYGCNFTALGFYAQHQAGANQVAIQGDAAGAAVPGAAAFFHTGEANAISQRGHQALIGRTSKLYRITVYGG